MQAMTTVGCNVCPSPTVLTVLATEYAGSIEAGRWSRQCCCIGSMRLDDQLGRREEPTIVSLVGEVVSMTDAFFERGNPLPPGSTSSPIRAANIVFESGALCTS